MAEEETACPMESESVAQHAGEVLDAVVGLGANLGTPLLTLRAAVIEPSRWGAPLRISNLYRSAPVGGPPQPDFLNAAVRLRFAGSSRALLERLQRVELQAGRVRRERWGPRTLDLDILWISGLASSETDLIIPHPRLRE